MIFNLREYALPESPRFRGTSLTDEVGAKLTGMGLYEVPPGVKHWPYHFEVTEEEWLVVVEGEVVLRTPDGERVMRAGDVACFPAGTAHAIRNDSDANARFVMPSTQPQYGSAVVYPDSGKFVIRAPGGFSHRGYLGDEVDYWEGES